MTPGLRAIHVRFDKSWASRERHGLLSADPRVRTLCRVLVTYPEVRHVVTDRIRLAAAAEPRTVETIVRFLERQHWLVESVSVE
jgi:hypothetical protein